MQLTQPYVWIAVALCCVSLVAIVWMFIGKKSPSKTSAPSSESTRVFVPFPAAPVAVPAAPQSPPAKKTAAATPVQYVHVAPHLLPIVPVRPAWYDYDGRWYPDPRYDRWRHVWHGRHGWHDYDGRYHGDHHGHRPVPPPRPDKPPQPIKVCQGKDLQCVVNNSSTNVAIARSW